MKVHSVDIYNACALYLQSTFIILTTRCLYPFIGVCNLVTMIIYDYDIYIVIIIPIIQYIYRHNNSTLYLRFGMKVQTNI